MDTYTNRGSSQCMHEVYAQLSWCAYYFADGLDQCEYSKHVRVLVCVIPLQLRCHASVNIIR